jgi:hypothetical protein
VVELYIRINMEVLGTSVYFLLENMLVYCYGETHIYIYIIML